jgi:metal-responsive CopG/Arc/MetJ family transcriptional regulator
MGTESRRVQFRAPERLVEQADALATADDKTRTDVLIEALREHVADATDDERVKQAIAGAYYDDHLTFEQTKALVGVEEATNFRVLKDQLREIDELVAEADDTSEAEG